MTRVLAARWLLLLGLVASGPAMAAPRDLRVSLPADSSCPTQEALLAQLRAELPGWQIEAGPPRPDALALRLSPLGADVEELELFDGIHALERRTLRADPASCADLPLTVALVVKVWVRGTPEANPLFEPLPPPAAAPKKHPHPSEASAVTVEPPAPSPEVVAPAEVPDSGPPPAEVVIDAGPPAVVAAPDAGPPAPIVLAVDAGALVVQRELTPPDSPNRFGMEVRAGGGALVSASDATVSPTVQAQLDLGWTERFGLDLGASWDGPLHGALTPGTIQVSRLAFALDARLSLFPLESHRARVNLLFGLALQRLAAESQGYSQPGSVSAVDPGIELGAFWQQALVGGLQLWAGPQARLWFREDRFEIANLGTVIASPRLWVGLSGGLAWRLF